MKLTKRELNRTKSKSNTGLGTPGKSKTTEVISRRDTVSRKVPTETIEKKNRKTPKTPEEGLGMELGERTRRRF